ncbi:MAG: Fur family transcriptional regulator iron response regulator, partial [Xanthobacteraceae bacterium]
MTVRTLIDLTYQDSAQPGDGKLSTHERVSLLQKTGCPIHDVRSMLREVGLRPTRQRMALGWILFAKGDRHVTAEMLYDEATKARVPVSLATVYNTLHQFTEAGLLREIAVDGSKAYFDTNLS